MRRLAAAEAFPMKNRISIGSTVQEIHRIPTPMASIKVQDGSPIKSNWTTDASWFSITTDQQDAHN